MELEYLDVSLAAQSAIEKHFSLQTVDFDSQRRSASRFEHELKWVRIHSNGFSDARIFRLTNQYGDFAVRSWPADNATLSKVRFWHAFDKVPGTRTFPKLYAWSQGETESQLCFPAGGLMWTLCDWVPGRSVLSTDVTLDFVRHLATMLAELHKATWILSSSASGNLRRFEALCSRTLQERTDFLQSIEPCWHSKLNQSDFLRKYQLADLLKTCLDQILDHKTQWLSSLVASSQMARRCHWIVRDLWHENLILNEEGQFSSIVDLGAARLDWPGLDFIRLVGSLIGLRFLTSVDVREQFQGWWKEAYQIYTVNHPEHSLGTLEECIRLNDISVALSIAQWVLWATDGTVDVDDEVKSERCSNRIKQLCGAFFQNQSI